jgi:23S rRNA (guanosine2251-2'-O)-methyltransferase
MRQLVVIAHNIRSSHNVGSLLRTADGLGVQKVYLTGYTPYPTMTNDERLPHQARKATAAIAKTALGAEKSSIWEYLSSVEDVLEKLSHEGFQLIALEQSEKAKPLSMITDTDTPIALLIGNEVTGVPPELLSRMNSVVEIPMHGEKESFNVVIATAMALYHLRTVSLAKNR